MALVSISDAVHADSDQITGADSHLFDVGSIRSQQTRERTMQCYAAQFQSWCQAFGEHENIMVNDQDGSWLLGKNQIGLVLSKPAFRQVNREIIFQGKTRTLVFDEQGIRIGQFTIGFKSKSEKQVLGVIDQFFESGANLHLFRTLHFLYGNGKRILTISSKRPQPFIYREIGTMNVKLQ